MQISEFFKNKNGQFSSEEALKIGAGVMAIALAVLFFLTPVIGVDKGSYVMIAEGVLWGYALAQGGVHNVTNQ